MQKYILYIFFLVTNFSFANITLPSVFSDHMVLQQNDEVKFWGWGNPNEEVIIKPSWTQEIYKVKANNLAKWEILIETTKYGGTYTVSFKGYNEIILNDVLIGEVWLCSGQSNMEMTANWGDGILNGDEEVLKANHPNIRFFNVPKISAEFPQNNLCATWVLCTPETMKNNSAVAYFFATRLQENLKNVPIGLIISAWGCAPAEIWIPKEIIGNDAILSKAGELLRVEECGQKVYGSAFNQMIYPLAKYNIAGVIWYQGESNVGASNYDKTLSALIDSWRMLWKKNFPFYYVQIAPWQYGEDNYGGVEIRDAQRRVLNSTKKTGMIVIDDVSTVDDIHPKEKKPVGLRLANLALKYYYKIIDDLVESPLFKSASFEKGKVRVLFDNSDGLYIKDEQSLFEIAGEDAIFYSAKAKVKDNQVEVSSKKVKNPKYVRFAWKNTAQSNVFNKANLPASTFTTEDYNN